jgi:AraC family transcriptional regulator
MSSRVDLISLSTKPFRLVHESQFVVMVLQPGTMDLSIDGAPTERLEYMAGDIALCRRHTIGLQEIPKLKDLRIRALMTAVNIERASGFPSGQLFLQSIEVALSAALVHTYSLSMNARRSIKGGLNNVGRRNVIELVRSRISEDISLADMAAVTGLSITHFSHIFKKSMGESPHQFVLQQRVQCAKELLVSLNLRMIDIALACGFKTQQHFARIFRKMCGLSPTEYQRFKLSKRLRDSKVRSCVNSEG